jgi:hypothetical protein
MFVSFAFILQRQEDVDEEEEEEAKQFIVSLFLCVVARHGLFLYV